MLALLSSRLIFKLIRLLLPIGMTFNLRTGNGLLLSVDGSHFIISSRLIRFKAIGVVSF